MTEVAAYVMLPSSSSASHGNAFGIARASTYDEEKGEWLMKSMYGTSARNSLAVWAFNRIALEKRLEKAQVQASKENTDGSKDGNWASIEACSRCSFSCMDRVACRAGEPSRNLSSSSSQVKVAATSATLGRTVM